MQYSPAQRYVAEFIGTALLLATVVGSGIMAERLAGGNVAIALLGNTIPTGAILVVIITMFGPISGAHINPAVTLVFALRGEISIAHSSWYVFVQITGGLAGMLAAHLMFDLSIMQASAKARTGLGQWFAELIATFGLVFTILAGLRARPQAVPALVGLYIMAALWFTASTGFANPAVTIARVLTDTFSGISPADAPAFIIAELAGAALAVPAAQFLWPDEN